MSQSLHHLGVHIVFSTQHRRPYLADDIRPRVHAYQARILQNLECRDIVVGGIADHVHVVCEIPAKLSVAKVLEILKKESSKLVKTLDPELALFHWQNGYGAFSVGPEDSDRVRHYVRTQEEHHRHETFQDEFRRLLTSHEIPFDERYLWG